MIVDQGPNQEVIKGIVVHPNTLILKVPLLKVQQIVQGIECIVK